MPTTLTRPWRGFVGWIGSMNANRLKWTGIVTYFGVYALLFFDIHAKLNEYLVKLPARVRPPPIEPVWVVLDLPKSVSMGLFSLGVTAIVLSAVIFRSAWTTLAAGRGTPRDEPSQGEPVEAPSVGWNAGAGGRTETARPNVDHEQYNLRVTDRQNRRSGRSGYHGGGSGSGSGEPDWSRSGEFHHDQLSVDSPDSKAPAGRAGVDETPTGRADGDGRRWENPPNVEQMVRSRTRVNPGSESQSASRFGGRTTGRSGAQPEPKPGTQGEEEPQDRTTGDEPVDDPEADDEESWPQEWVSGGEL